MTTDPQKAPPLNSKSSGLYEMGDSHQKYNYLSHIYGGIYVSSYDHAKDFDGRVIFVHHDVQWYSKGLHIPLLSKRPNSDTDRTGAKVNEENLDLIHELITNSFIDKSRILIHCRGGVERSPLVVATWLRSKRGFTLDDAYKYIMDRRPVVEYRGYWLD
jgi:Dual specificity phosphatase, catalytic domain